MPSLGADMDSGTLISWRIKPGDRVRRGDIVAEVDTEKSVIEVETFSSGVVEEILVWEGDRVPVGTPLAIIREDDGAAAVPGRPPAPEPVAETPVRRVSPRARRRAGDLGVDVAAVAGTGPDGAVTSEDVERFAAGQRAPSSVGPEPVGTAGGEAEGAPSAAPLSREERRAALRRAVASSMARSKREIPHYYLATEIEVSAAMAHLAERNSRALVTDRILPAAVLLRAVALALRETPDLNGFFEDGVFRPGPGIHLGVAIAVKGGGLVAPAIHDADRLALPDLMSRLSDLVARTRSGGLRASEMAEATITVTNLGDQGVDAVFPVIYPPQVAIVGFGRIRERAWAEGGMLGVRPVVTASLAADHRVSDGHRGAVFLAALDRALHAPEQF